MTVELVLPSEKYKNSFFEALDEQESNLKSRIEGNKYFPKDDFKKFLKDLEDERLGKNLTGDRVPQTVYWLVDGDKFLGRFSIRHYLNENLLKIGGHIGYSLRPSERGKGYGTMGLKLTLPKARELGIKDALITCDSTNLASKRVIEKNGGVFENEVEGEDGVKKLRYWVKT